MLIKEGYIDGMGVKRSVDNRITVNSCNPCITLKGLEYLNENSFMKKAADLAKGLKDSLLEF